MKRFWNNNNKYKDSAVPGSGVCKLAISECILPITDTTDMAISVPIPIPINISVHLYTENTKHSFLQPFLQDKAEDSFAKENSFMYGHSTSNQVSSLSIKNTKVNFTLVAAYRGIVGTTA